MARRYWPWDVLGIDRTSDKGAIRSAYAARLKAMDVDADIQGFANLRGARDQALREADRTAPEPLDDPLLDAAFENEPDPASEGPDGPDDAWPDDDVEPWYSDDDDRPGPAWDNEFGYGTGDLYDADLRVAHLEEDGSPDAPDQRLARLLYPSGAYSDEAFTHEENEKAQAALGDLLADARSGDLGREQAVDQWLADMLAESWPRSGPLVERAAEAFDWVAQSGEIGERPALQFLNPRVRGLWFVAKVEQPDHPFHPYWEELKRPGKRGFLDRFRVKREGIENLLGGIRTRYPEVESYLDHERVASWEKPAPSWVAWIVQRVFIFIVVIQLLAYCGGMMGGDDLPQDQLDQVVAEAFGPGRTMAELQAADPELANLIHATIEFDKAEGDPLPQIETAVVVRMRELAALALEDAPRADVLAILAVRRDLFEAAREAGTPTCAALLKTARLPDGVTVPEATRAGERALLWRLAQAKLLNTDWAGQDGATVPIPPWVGQGVTERTRLPVERINAVLRGGESQDLCAVRIALIDTLLSRPDDAPLELLRSM